MGKIMITSMTFDRVNFLGQEFNSEKERNAYLFKNKDSLLINHNKKKSLRILLGIWIGIILAILFVSMNAWWSFVFLFIAPAALYYLKVKDIEKIKKYAKLHEQFLVEVEQACRDILSGFDERYFTDVQKSEHIFDLVNLINHKKELALTEEDILFLLGQYKKAYNERLYDEEVLKNFPNYHNISEYGLAKIIVKLNPHTDFKNEESYKVLFSHICEYLTKKDIKYNVTDLKSALNSEYLKLQAIRFDQKLSENSDKKITAEQVEQLDGFEFEQLLGDIFIKAGYKVIVTKKTGDQGADLIVEKNGISTAIQSKKYIGSVGNKAVQEVVAAMKYYDCDKSMVITTGEFTKGARVLAERNNVQLIGKDKIDDLFYIISK